MKIRYIVIIIILLSLFFSCKTKQKNNTKQEQLAKTKLYDNAVKANVDYKSLFIKFTVKYKNSKNSMGLKGTAKIRKDSVIIVSLIAVLGIEAARLKFTKDSLFIIDRLNGKVKKGSYKYLKKTFNIDFNYNDLQSVLTNNFFIFPHSKSDKEEFIKNFKFTKDSINTSVYRKLPNSIENIIKLKKNSYKISDYLISDVPQNRLIKLKYEDIYSNEMKGLPKKIYILSSNNKKITNINLTYRKISKNKQLRYTFKIPKNYKIKKYE